MPSFRCMSRLNLPAPNGLIGIQCNFVRGLYPPNHAAGFCRYDALKPSDAVGICASLKTSVGSLPCATQENTIYVPVGDAIAVMSRDGEEKNVLNLHVTSGDKFLLVERNAPIANAMDVFCPDQTAAVHQLRVNQTVRLTAGDMLFCFNRHYYSGYTADPSYLETVIVVTPDFGTEAASVEGMLTDGFFNAELFNQWHKFAPTMTSNGSGGFQIDASLYATYMQQEAQVWNSLKFVKVDSMQAGKANHLNLVKTRAKAIEKTGAAAEDATGAAAEDAKSTKDAEEAKTTGKKATKPKRARRS